MSASKSENIANVSLSFEKYMLNTTPKIHTTHRLILEENKLLRTNLLGYNEKIRNLEFKLNELNKEFKLLSKSEKKKNISRKITEIKTSLEEASFVRQEYEFNLKRFLKRNLTGMYGVLAI